MYYRRFLLVLSLVVSALTACSDGGSSVEPLSTVSDLQISSSLSNQRILGMTQDSLGYIWIATYRGLNRYNGREMQQYFCDDTPHSIPDNQVWDVFTDKTGRVWVATKSGVAYYTENDDFAHVRLPNSSNLSQCFAQNRGGDIFLLQSHQVLRYDSTELAFQVVIDDIGSTSYINNKIYIDAEDKLWVINDHRVLCYNSYTLKCLETINFDDWYIYRSCLIGDQLWLANQNQLRIYDVVLHQWMPVPSIFSEHPMFQHSYVESIYNTPQGDVLLGTRNGLFLYDPADDSLIHQSEAAFPFEAPAFVVCHIFCDNEPNLWLCSESQGFSVLSQDHRRFNSDSYLRSTFTGVPVASVALDAHSNLWIGTQQQGLYSYHLSTHEIHHYDLPVEATELNGEQRRLYAVYVDSRGDFWLACTPNGVLQLRPNGQKLSLVRSYNIMLPIAIGEDSRGTIWVGSYSHTYYSHRPDDLSFQEHRILTNAFTYTSCLLPSHDGRMAALTKSLGLRYIDTEQMEMMAPEFSDSTMAGCISRSVFLPSAGLFDAQDNLWIGTVSNGLLFYDTSTHQLTSVPGAPCEDISSLEFDLDGNLWVSTQYGIGQMNIQTREFINYFVSDGIGGNEFYDRCSCRLPDGTLVFGGAHGLTVFNPSDLQNDKQPRLYFENLKIDNRLVRPRFSESLDQALYKASQIDLDYNQTNFGISFSVLDFSGSERYNYQYKLEGFNDQWVDAQTNHEAFYANLSSGHYNFKVRAISKDQQRIIAERNLPIYIHPAPWASWWAWMAYLILTGALFIYIFRLIRRIRSERRTRLISEREKEHERRINRMNMSFFANVSHEFRTPLTIISAPIAQLVADNRLSSDVHTLLCIVQRSVNRMLRLVNQMMDFHKLEDDALRLEVRRQDIIQLLRQSAEIFRLQATEKKIQLNTYGMEDNYLLWIDADKIEKIIYNLLGNAVKYTPSGGRIDLSFDATAQYVHITVADTGQGIPEDQLTKIFERYYQLRRQEQGQFNWGTGIGLYYAQKLAQLHHGSIRVENRKEGTGSIFTVTLPASEAAYSEAEKTSLPATQSALYPLPTTNNTEVESDLSVAAPNAADNALPTVLVIDDDVEIVHYVKTLLQTTYQVIGRFDADSGLEIVRQKAPDIILCDVMMPGRDGLDFCHEVKNDIQLCHIPVVLITAKTATSDMVQGLGSGADAYVAKPFDPSYLMALIGSILKNREKTRHLLAANTQTEALEADVLSPQDKVFMTELYKIMEQELANPDLDVSHMTEFLHVSRSKLYYKIKGLTGENPSVFFRQYKLNRAAEMIREGRYNISEISLLTGFSSLSHFSTSFKRQFGVAPSDY